MGASARASWWCACSYQTRLKIGDSERVEAEQHTAFHADGVCCHGV